MEKKLKIATAAMLLGFGAHANVIDWPVHAEYQPLYSGANPYSDIGEDIGNNGHDHLDIVGDSTYAAGYLLHREAPGTPSDTEDQLFIRIRLNDFKNNMPGAYQVYFETDGNNSVDWVMQFETTDLDSNGTLTFSEASGTNRSSVIFGPTVWTGGNTDTRWTGQPTSDSSNFDNDPDYFLDMAMSWDAFSTHTGIISTNDAFRILIASSQNENTLDGDMANSSVENVNFEVVYSDTIPEAMSITLILSIGASMLAARRIFGE
ncbi:MAG: hypothetical protein ABFR33_10630 [Verrucomicrobiota bacterium]